jgi:hypothetical protein
VQGIEFKLFVTRAAAEMPPLLVYNNPMRSRLVLVLWIAGILFPLVGLRRISMAYDQAFDAIFRQEWVHILMHILLYTVLGLLLIAILKLPLNRNTVLKLTAAAFIIGVLQESLQWLTTSDTPSQARMIQLSGFDLGVDLAGVFLGLALALWSQKLPGSTGSDDRTDTKTRER